MILLANNAQSLLAAAITADDTSCEVTTGQGGMFPNPSTGDWFMATIADAATGLIREIVKVTANADDTFTIERAQEGTVALAWDEGSPIANLVTAGTLGGFAQAAPVGSVVAFAAATAPQGWLACDGASLATDDYPGLFLVIGYDFGGSGPNFSLPDLDPLASGVIYVIKA